MKKLLSLVLALAMTFAIAAPALAAEFPPVDTADNDFGIMPLSSLYSNTVSDTSGRWKSYDFTATPSNGNYIRIWFENTTDERVTVILYRYNTLLGRLPVCIMNVSGNSGQSKVYHTSDAGSATYYLSIEASESGGLIQGTIAAAQYATNPG